MSTQRLPILSGGKEFQKACREYEAEIDILAAQLVREGCVPYEALKRATIIVQRQRQTETKNNYERKK